MKKFIAVSLFALLCGGCAGHQTEKSALIQNMKSADFGEMAVTAWPQYYICFHREKSEVAAEIQSMWEVGVDKYTADWPGMVSDQLNTNTEMLIGDAIGRDLISKHAWEFATYGLTEAETSSCDNFYRRRESVFASASK